MNDTCSLKQPAGNHEQMCVYDIGEGIWVPESQFLQNIPEDIIDDTGVYYINDTCQISDHSIRGFDMCVYLKDEGTWISVQNNSNRFSIIDNNVKINENASYNEDVSILTVNRNKRQRKKKKSRPKNITNYACVKAVISNYSVLRTCIQGTDNTELCRKLYRKFDYRVYQCLICNSNFCNYGNHLNYSVLYLLYLFIILYIIHYKLNIKLQ